MFTVSTLEDVYAISPAQQDEFAKLPIDQQASWIRAQREAGTLHFKPNLREQVAASLQTITAPPEEIDAIVAKLPQSGAAFQAAGHGDIEHQLQARLEAKRQELANLVRERKQLLWLRRGVTSFLLALLVMIVTMSAVNPALVGILPLVAVVPILLLALWTDTGQPYGVDERIRQLVEPLNAVPLGADELEQPTVFTVEDFLADQPLAANYLGRVRDMLSKGEIAIGLYVGLARRLGHGPLYGQRFWELARQYAEAFGYEVPLEV